VRKLYVSIAVFSAISFALELPQNQKELIERYKRELKPQIRNLLKEANETKEFFEYRNGTIHFDYEGWVSKLEKKHSRRIEEAQRGGRVLILMSSSVPLEVWKNYVCFVEENKLPAVFVLRGFVGGIKSGIKPTLNFVRKLIEGWSCPGKIQKVHKIEIEIDPWAFRKFGIKEVPAVIYKDKVSTGDWSLEWHLERLGYPAELR